MYCRFSSRLDRRDDLWLDHGEIGGSVSNEMSDFCIVPEALGVSSRAYIYFRWSKKQSANSLFGVSFNQAAQIVALTQVLTYLK